MNAYPLAQEHLFAWCAIHIVQQVNADTLT